MTYLDLADPAEDGALPEKTGRVILSGGEALLDPLRFEVTYKVVERLTAKYAGRGGVKIVMQTTGDLLDGRIVTDLLERRDRCRQGFAGRRSAVRAVPRAPRQSVSPFRRSSSRWPIK